MRRATELRSSFDDVLDPELRSLPPNQFAVAQRARIRLFLTPCSTSANPSSSITGGT